MFCMPIRTINTLIKEEHPYKFCKLHTLKKQFKTPLRQYYVRLNRGRHSLQTIVNTRENMFTRMYKIDVNVRMSRIRK